MPKETKSLTQGTNIKISPQAYVALLRKQGELQASEGRKRNIMEVVDYILDAKPAPPVEVEGKS